MTRFYVCETTHGTPCVFTARTMVPLWKKSGGDIARCIRHGCLICSETSQPDKKAAQAWAKRDRQ